MVLMLCYRSRSGSLPAIGAEESMVAPSVDRHQQPSDSPGVTMATASSSRQSYDSAYSSASLESASVSPKPSTALRHLIRCSAPPSHVTIRTGSTSRRPVMSSSAASSGPPALPVQQNPTRTGSAQRFRNMVLECRNAD